MHTTDKKDITYYSHHPVILQPKYAARYKDSIVIICASKLGEQVIGLKEKVIRLESIANEVQKVQIDDATWRIIIEKHNKRYKMMIIGEG